MKLALFVKALITLPRQESDKLIFLASSKVSPTAPEFLTFSEPARSIKFNFPFFSTPFFINF